MSDVDWTPTPEQVEQWAREMTFTYPRDTQNIIERAQAWRRRLGVAALEAEKALMEAVRAEETRAIAALRDWACTGGLPVEYIGKHGGVETAVVECIYDLRTENQRLREAIRWALEPGGMLAHLVTNEMDGLTVLGYWAELRRRAGMEDVLAAERGDK